MSEIEKMKWPGLPDHEYDVTWPRGEQKNLNQTQTEEKKHPPSKATTTFDCWTTFRYQTNKKRGEKRERPEAVSRPLGVLWCSKEGEGKLGARHGRGEPDALPLGGE